MPVGYLSLTQVKWFDNGASSNLGCLLKEVQDLNKIWTEQEKVFYK